MTVIEACPFGYACEDCLIYDYCEDDGKDVFDDDEE